ncbi:MAG: hypothetical protein Tsb0014_46710 [Pleurocapsa sp.]
MLKSYEAKIENDRIQWLSDEPKPKSARVIVTIVEDTTSVVKRRVPPASIAGKGQTLGNLVEPIVSEQDWQCLQ